MAREHLERPEKDTAYPRTTDALGADIKNSDEVLEADEVRREDDRRTAIRQERAAEGQEDARRFLDQNATLLNETGSTLEGTQRRLAENREDIEALQDGLDELREDTRQLARDADDTGPDR